VPDSGIAQTIPTLFRSAVDDAAGSTWLRAGDDAYTFGDALGRLERAAAWCRAAGVTPGDRVLVTAKNTPDFLLLWLGLMEAGAIQVPINPRAAATEVAGFVRQVAPRSIVTDADLAPMVDSVAGDTPVLDVAEVMAAEPDGRGPAAIDGDDIAVMIPTSGTTGRSKLVMQTHRAYVMAGEGFPWWMGLTSDDRLMTSLPLFHINAPAYSTLGSVAARAGLVLLPAFSASRFLDSARRYGATEFNAIGAMLEILMRQPERPDDADTPLRLCYTGPSPARGRQEEIEARFGLEIVCGYALSESPYGLIWPRGARPYGALGVARQHPTLGRVNEARVVDDAGRELGPGETGELLLRNPAVTPGYWRMPETTAETIVDGWLHTGDLVTVNADGTYTFVSRRKEVLRRRGENLSPAEVEEAILAHPDVLECAVVGVPSDLSEEEIKAFVVPAPGCDLDFGELHAWTASRLSAFKVPRFWQALEALPRTSTARVAKHRLPTGQPAGEYDAAIGAGRPQDRP
jgi:carnitine-CoA ligase